MKLAKGVSIKQHIKMSSEDLNKSSNTRNYFISKLLNKSNSKVLKTETIETENLGNFKTNIQNIFANDDKRKKAIQYVIKIRNQRNSSPQNDIFNINNKTKGINVNKSEINIIPNKTNKGFFKENNVNQRNSNQFDINNDKNNFKTLEYNFYNLYNDKTFNNEFFNNNINEIKRRETMHNKQHPYIKSNIFLDDKNEQNLKHKKIPSNNVLKNYQNNALYNNKKEKNYNMNKIKNKMLNIKEQDNKYPQIIPKNEGQPQNQTMFNTQINFNYNTNKKYYVHKNLVYSKINNPSSKNNNPNTKVLLNPKNTKQKIISVNNNNNINNIYKNNNIIIEKIFNPQKLIRINTNYFTIKNKKLFNNIFIEKNQIKLNKNKFILSNQHEFIITAEKTKNKFEFNFVNEKEMVNYIKNNYDEKKIKEMFNINKDEEKIINLKNENNILKNEIEILKDENEQCKIELNDIRNQYNDLNKELIIAKEENEKLKDNFINNMIEDDNNEINDEL